VFLKRDVVSIEQQTAKLNQVRRWEFSTSTLRRIVGVTMPGAYHVVSGKVLIGQLINAVFVVLMVACFVWFPLFFRSAEPLIEIVPLQVACLAFAAFLWLHSALASWYGR
jgi:hypothetical protein